MGLTFFYTLRNIAKHCKLFVCFNLFRDTENFAIVCESLHNIMAFH